MKKIIFLCLFLLFGIPSIFCQNNYREKLKRQLSTAKEDNAKVELFFRLSNSYLFSYADTCAMFAKQGILLAQKINDTNGEISCMNMLGVSLATMGNFTAALDVGFKALTIAENFKDIRLVIYSNNVLMNCYKQQEDYKEALVYGHKAEKLLTTPYADTTQASVILGIIGSVYEKTNQLDSALLYSEKSYALSQDWSEIFRVLGNIHAKMEHTDLALNFYRKGLAVATNQFDYVGLVEIYNEMSKVFEKMGKTDSSIYYAQKAIIHEGIHAYPEGVLRASDQLASLYEMKGRSDSTIKYLKLANALNDSLFSRKKTRETQSLEFNEKMHKQELATQEYEAENKMKMYALLAIISIFLVIAFFLWRNNRHKQRINAQLQEQKQEIQTTLTELKSTQAQLIQSEKMASLGELTAGIAHEIQNPLNFVNNFSEVNMELIGEMQQELADGNLDGAKIISNEIKGNEQKINHHGKRADVIVKGMLQHTQLSAGKKEPTDINALVDEYLRLAYHGFRSKGNSFKAEINTNYGESVNNINILPRDIGMVLLNLFNNAFYSMRDKKGLQVDGYEPSISVYTKRIGHNVLISVKDNGNGIPQKIIEKIFQPFFTTKPTGQGTGLGLSISYDIVKAHGGELKVESHIGEDAEFLISLPGV